MWLFDFKSRKNFKIIHPTNENVSMIKSWMSSIFFDNGYGLSIVPHFSLDGGSGFIPSNMLALQNLVKQSACVVEVALVAGDFAKFSLQMDMVGVEELSDVIRVDNSTDLENIIDKASKLDTHPTYKANLDLLLLRNAIVMDSVDYLDSVVNIKGVLNGADVPIGSPLLSLLTAFGSSEMLTKVLPYIILSEELKRNYVEAVTFDNIANAEVLRNEFPLFKTAEEIRSYPCELKKSLFSEEDLEKKMCSAISLFEYGNFDNMFRNTTEESRQIKV